MTSAMNMSVLTALTEAEENVKKKVKYKYYN